MPMRELFNRILKLVGRDRATAELEEEMRLHLELRAEKLRAEGMTDVTASAEARRRFGNVGATVEASRDTWGWASADQLLQDVRIAWRRLRQRPAFSVPVVVVLALGIGATTAVFSAVDAAMLRPLPFLRARELFTLNRVNVPLEIEGRQIPSRFVTIGDVAAMKDVFTDVSAYASGGLNLSDPDRPQRVNAGVVTEGFFRTLGVRPYRGRTFSPEEGRPRGPLVVVLSYGFWQRQFGGSEMVGRSIVLHGKSYEVVGIMPEGFSFPQSSDLWIPMTVPLTFAVFEPFRGWLPSFVLARSAPGVLPGHAAARLLARWEQSVTPDPAGRRSNADETLDEIRRNGPMAPLQRQLLGNRRNAMFVLLGATGCLLLIACANVANLLLSDGAKRRREIAVREVLGATRRRVARQLLVESGLLALCGAVAGLVLAPVALRLLRATLPTALVGIAPVEVNLRVLGFAFLLAMVTSLLFGLWPAFAATRGDASTAIKAGGGHGATAGGMGRVRAGLVVLEVALTVVLLVGAGLMLRSFARLLGEDIGMRPSQVATLETSFPRVVQPAEHARIVNAVLTRLTSQPGISAAAAVNDLPLRGTGGISVTIDVPGYQRAKGEIPMARVLYATSGYFETMGIRLLSGRTFGDGGSAQLQERTQVPGVETVEVSDEERHSVAIVSKAMAEQYWPGVDPIGRYFTWRGDTIRMTVVGVVADVREWRIDTLPGPQVYLPIAQASPRNIAIVARGSLPPTAFLARMTEAMRGAEPSQAMYNVKMMDQVVGASVAPRRTNTILIALFAALALVLSALGVYAVLAYGVAQRTREFGIRAALGATAGDIVRLVSRDMVALVALGIVVGMAVAWAASRVMGSLLYGIEARDPATFTAVPLVLILPALLATLVPVLRAVRVNPTSVMREE